VHAAERTGGLSVAVQWLGGVVVAASRGQPVRPNDLGCSSFPPSPFWLRRWWLCGECGSFWLMEVLNGGVRRGGLEGLRPRQLPPPHSPLLF
jgi:hypothetical protein